MTAGKVGATSTNIVTNFFLNQTTSIVSFSFLKMLLQKMFGRTLHTTRQLYKSSTGLEKSALAALRKKTGYTFANCKKALELHNNDVNQVREEREIYTRRI